MDKILFHLNTSIEVFTSWEVIIKSFEPFQIILFKMLHEYRDWRPDPAGISRLMQPRKKFAPPSADLDSEILIINLPPENEAASVP